LVDSAEHHEFHVLQCLVVLEPALASRHTDLGS